MFVKDFKDIKKTGLFFPAETKRYKWVNGSFELVDFNYRDEIDKYSSNTFRNAVKHNLIPEIDNSNQNYGDATIFKNKDLSTIHRELKNAFNLYQSATNNNVNIEDFINNIPEYLNKNKDLNNNNEINIQDNNNGGEN